jgi:hypothetical protein
VSKLLVNLDRVQWADVDEDGDVCLYFYNNENTQFIPPSQITFYGNGEGIARTWLRELAGEQEKED